MVDMDPLSDVICHQELLEKDETENKLNLYCCYISSPTYLHLHEKITCNELLVLPGNTISGIPTS